MTARIETLGQLLRLAVERRERRAKTASWRNPDWQYRPAATHSDSASFRERQIARGLRINRKEGNQ